MSTSLEVTKKLLEKAHEEKAEEKTYEEIVKAHLRKCEDYAKALGLTEEQMRPLYSQDHKILLAKMLETQMMKFFGGVEKGEGSQKLANIIIELNKELQPWEIVFKLTYGEILEISIYGQQIDKNYLKEIYQDFRLAKQIDESIPGDSLGWGW